MTNRLPIDIATHVKSVIYESADRAKYMAMSRTEAGRFMDDLVKHNEIGGALENYIPKHQIRHYIKDAVLNRYTKDKAEDAYLIEIEALIQKLYGLKVFESDKGDGALLYRTLQPDKEAKYVVVAKGTFLKWETALRKALLFIAASPFQRHSKSIQILLTLYTQGKIITHSDKELLNNAIKQCAAKAHFIGE